MSCLSMKDSAEIKRIFVAHKRADLLDGITGIFKELLCLADPDGGKVLHGSDAHITFETADKPAYAHMLFFCVFFYTDILRKGFVEKTDAVFRFFMVAESVCGGFELAPGYTVEKLLEKKAEKFFRAGAFELELYNDPAKKLRIIGRDTAGKEVCLGESDFVQHF